MDSADEITERLSNGWRALWGAYGSLLAVLVKFHGQDIAKVQLHLDTHSYERLTNLGIAYALLLAVSIPVGAIIAAAFRENNRGKILIMAIAAPALVTTWAGGERSSSASSAHGSSFFIGSAFAADQTPTNAESGISIKDGLRQFFGYSNDDSSRYYVIAGPYKNENEATLTAKRLMQRRPSLPVFLGDIDAKTGAASIIIGQSQRYPAARTLMDSVKAFPELKGVDDIYLTSKPPKASVTAPGQN